jgi:WD40 repeat protein
MSAIYYSVNQIVYTGGHDGTLIAWNFETGYKKHSMHENDPTCTSKDHLMDGKSVDQLLILDNRPNPKLVSMSADQWLRFWNINELGDQSPTFKFWCKHPEDDGLTAIATTKDNDLLITADTSGQMKLWDISEVDLDNPDTKNFFLERYFIIAHRATINTI